MGDNIISFDETVGFILITLKPTFIVTSHFNKISYGAKLIAVCVQSFHEQAKSDCSARILESPPQATLTVLSPYQYYPPKYSAGQVQELRETDMLQSILLLPVFEYTHTRRTSLTHERNKLVYFHDSISPNQK